MHSLLLCFWNVYCPYSLFHSITYSSGYGGRYTNPLPVVSTAKAISEVSYTVPEE